jgi:uncharacterized coiled-coil protein SlyX
VKEETDMLYDHEKRITELEAHRVQQEKINMEIRNQLVLTENTVIKESGKQQEMTQKLLDHVLSSKTFKQQQFWKVVGLLAGSGGVLYLILQSLVP